MKIRRHSSSPLTKDDLKDINQRSDRASRASKSNRNRSRSRQRNTPTGDTEKEVQSHLQRLIDAKYTFNKSKKLKALNKSPELELASPELSNENWTPPPVEPLYKSPSRIRTSNSHFSNLRRFRTNTNTSVEPVANPITEVNDEFLSMKRTRSTTMDRQPSESFLLNSAQASSSDVDVFRDTDVYEMEILYENQRGLFLFGTVSFKSLLPIDPAPYTNSQGEPSPYTPESIQPPDPLWEWVHPHMLVDMSCRRKRDEAGWEYNTWFKNSRWTQCGGPFSYVRRRKWIRLRKRPANAPILQSPSQLQSNQANSIRTRARSSSHLKIPNSPKSANSTNLSSEVDNTPPASIFELDNNCEVAYLPVRPSDLPASSASFASSNSFINRTNSQNSQISVADPFLHYPIYISDEDQKVWDQINLRRLTRIQSACQLDRERIQLWHCWLALNKVEVYNVIQSHYVKIYSLMCYETYRKQLEALFEKVAKSKDNKISSPFLLTSLEPTPEISLPPLLNHTTSQSPIGKFRPQLQMSPLSSPIHSRRSSLSLRPELRPL
ncbi:hypothetical protein E3Q11_03507 [Wallemia mellicola]|nr:hypothetical protein E3Q11_03507 [Wallemia mellicola]